MGNGLIQPLQRVLSDFAVAGGKRQRKSQIEQVLGTRAGNRQTAGEVPWRPTFGSGLHRLRHAMNDESGKDIARTQVGEALRRWVASLRVESVEVQQDQDAGSIYIHVATQPTGTDEEPVEVGLTMETQ